MHHTYAACFADKSIPRAGEDHSIEDYRLNSDARSGLGTDTKVSTLKEGTEDHETSVIGAKRITSQRDFVRDSSQWISAKQMEEFYVCPITHCLMEDPVFAKVIIII